MQLLTNLPFYEETICSISTSGLTILKSGKYHERHIGMKSHWVDQRGKIAKRDKTPKTTHKKKKPKPVETESQPQADLPEKKESQPRTYSLKKAQIRHRIQNYVSALQGRQVCYFITVSFPAKTEDKICYQAFNTWLTRLRQLKIVGGYLWVAERQQNGTLHYHFTTHRYFDIRKANSLMRGTLTKLCSQGKIQYPVSSIKKYNGVDIAKDKKTKKVVNFALQKKQKSLSRYLTKYVTKNEGIHYSYCWHCSRDYSNIVIKVTFTFNELRKSNIKKTISLTPTIKTDFIDFYPFTGNPPPDLVNYLRYINRSIIELLN